MEWESLSQPEQIEKSWELVVKERTIQLVMKDIIRRLSRTIFVSRKDLVFAATKQVNSDPQWIEQAKEQLCSES